MIACSTLTRTRITGSCTTARTMGGATVRSVRSTATRQRVFALDAATGELLWKYEAKLPEDLTAMVRLIPQNRGAAIYQDKVYFGTIDARLIALNAKTGEVV